MMCVIYLASFTSSRSAEYIACGFESLLTEMSATRAFLGSMLDFQHRQTA